MLILIQRNQRVGGKMNKRVFSLILGLVGLLTLYEIFNNSYAVFFLLIVLGSFLLRNKLTAKNKRILLLIGFSSFIYLLFSSRFFLLFLVILFLLFLSDSSILSTFFSTIFSEPINYRSKHDFLMVDFEQMDNNSMTISKNRWIGQNDQSTETIYSWDDVNFTKLIGNSVFDLGNTLLPREQNVLLVQQGIGNIKILIPEGTAVSINVSVMVGKVIVGATGNNVLNENYRWHSANYYTQERKIKIVANLLVGNLEVVFL